MGTVLKCVGYAVGTIALIALGFEAGCIYTTSKKEEEQPQTTAE